MELIIDKNGKAVDFEDVSVTIICESKEEADRMKEGMVSGRVRLIEWHPVEVRDGEIVGELPEDGQAVLISIIYETVTVDFFCADEEGGYFEDWDWSEVKAWAPLPEPYKPREEGTT